MISFKAWRRRTATASALAALFLAGAMASADAADTKTLRVIAHADLKNIDPVFTTAGITITHGYLIYDKLFEFDAEGRVQPQMAAKLDRSADGLTYTIALRDGLKFSDGSPVTAADVVQSLKRWSARDAMGQILAGVTTEMTAADDKTVRIVLKEPFGLLPDALAGIRGNPAFIMPARVASTPPTEQIKDSTGSGPFVFDLAAWRPGEKITYRRNPHYTPRSEAQSFYAGGKVAGFEAIEMNYLPDANSAMAALARGEADIWELPPVDIARSMRGMPGVRVERGASSHGVVRPNHLHPPFDNVKARQALLYLMNQNEALAAAVGDPSSWTACGSFLGCGTTYGTEKGVVGVTAPADIARAKQLLTEAGYDGRPIVILDPTDLSDLHAIALYMAQQLRKAGATVEVQSMDWSTLVSRRGNKSPVGQGGWNLMPTYLGGLEAASPLTNAPLGTSCDRAWFGWACDARLEELKAEWRREPDLGKRKAIAEQIQARAFEVVPYVPYGQFFTGKALRDDLAGFIPDAPMAIYWGVKRK